MQDEVHTLEQPSFCEGARIGVDVSNFRPVQKSIHTYNILYHKGLIEEIFLKFFGDPRRL